MHNTTIRGFISFTLIFICLLAEGQSNTYSPYSRFGIGDILNNGFGVSRALGGLSTGLRYPNQVNYLNPASYSSQDSMSVIFDIGIIGSHIKYEETDGINDLESFYSNVNIDHMALSFPVTDWCYVSTGLVPYSSVGYKISNQSYVNEEFVKETYGAYGGINRFYIGSATKFLDHFAFGLNVSYLFGAMEYYQKAEFVDPITNILKAGTYITKKEEKIVVGDFLFDFGLQYFDSFSDNLTFTIGAVFNNKTTINTKNSVNSLLLRDLTFPNAVDTIEFIENEKGRFILPLNIGGGFTLNYKNRLLIGVDYSIQNWANTNQFNSDSLVNSNVLSAGIEYTPNPDALKGYLKKIHYRLGWYYQNTYLSIAGEQLKDYGITFGLGLPFRPLPSTHIQSSFNITCELGQRGTTNNNLVKESYAIWTVSLTLQDLWFNKSKFD